MTPIPTMSCPQNYTTGGGDVSMISLIRPSPVSKLTTKTMVDTGVNNDDDSQYNITPRKQNNNSNDLCDTNNTTAQVQIKLHPTLHLQIFQLQKHH